MAMEEDGGRTSKLVGLHQGSLCSPLLFDMVVIVFSGKIVENALGVAVCAVDLVPMVDGERELSQRVTN
jgi:hypothetical protein